MPNSPLLQEFKAFVLRGNVVDLAVAVIIATAFGVVVKSATTDLIMPVLAAIGGQPDFRGLDFTINDATFRYGNFITEVISFVILAAIIFFFVVKPVNWLLARSRNEPPADPTTMKCPDCLSEIPLEAKRCRYCTSVVA